MTANIKVTTNKDEVLRHDDGSPFPLAMLTEEETVFGDSYEDLLSHLIDGYPTVEETPEDVERAYELRWGFAASVANEMQDQYVQGAAEAGLLQDDAPEETKMVLGMDRSVRLELPGDVWEVEGLPLVLLATHYAPHTDYPAPTGNVAFLDPTNARTLLASMCRLLSGIEVIEREDA